MHWADVLGWVADAPSTIWAFLKAQKDGLTLLLALYAAAMSTFLAVGKSEWLQRRRVGATCSLANADFGNQVIIQNPSAAPVMIAHWKLYWLKGGEPADDVSQEFMDDPSFTVAAYSTHKLVFNDEDYFVWDKTARGDSVLYLELHFVGRKKPKRLKLYSHAD